MFNNFITVVNFKFFAEFFLITQGMVLTLILTRLKSKKTINYDLHRPIGRSIVLLFIMASVIIYNDLNWLEGLKEGYAAEGLNLNSSTSNDSLGVFFRFLICLFASAFFYIVIEHLDYQKVNSEYLLILYFAVVGLLLLCVCDDLLSSYLSIELISLSSYLLASYRKDSVYSVEAGLKYFVMGSISSAFFLLGSSLIYASSGTVVFPELHHLFSEFDTKYSKILTINNSINYPETENILLMLKKRNPSLSSNTLLKGLEAMDLELRTGIPAWSDFETEACLLEHKRLYRHLFDDYKQTYEYYRGFCYASNRAYSNLQKEIEFFDAIEPYIAQLPCPSNPKDSVSYNLKGNSYFASRHLDGCRDAAVSSYYKTVYSPCCREHNWRQLTFENFIDQVKKENPNIPESSIRILELLEKTLFESYSTGKIDGSLFYIINIWILGLYELGDAVNNDNLNDFLESSKITYNTPLFDFSTLLIGLEPNCFTNLDENSILLRKLSSMEEEIKTGVPAWSDSNLENQVIKYIRSSSSNTISEDVYELLRGVDYYNKKALEDEKYCAMITEAFIKNLETSKKAWKNYLEVYEKRKKCMHACNCNSSLLKILIEKSENKKYFEHIDSLHTSRQATKCFLEYPLPSKMPHPFSPFEESLLNAAKTDISSFHMTPSKSKLFAKIDRGFFNYEPNWRKLSFENFIESLKKENPNLPKHYIGLLRLAENDLVELKTRGTEAWSKAVLIKTVYEFHQATPNAYMDLNLLLDLDAKIKEKVSIETPFKLKNTLENIISIVKNQSFLLAEKNYFEAIRSIDYSNIDSLDKDYFTEFEKKIKEGRFAIDSPRSMYFRFNSLQNQNAINLLESLSDNNWADIYSFVGKMMTAKNLNEKTACYNFMLEKLPTPYFEALIENDKLVDSIILELKKEHPNVSDLCFDILKSINSSLGQIINWDDGILNTRIHEGRVLDYSILLDSKTKLRFQFDNNHFKLIELGILFILFSLFIKLSAAPFHLWSLDVYEGSPSISTFFFSVMTKLSLFLFLIRFCYSAFPSFIAEWQFYSIWIASISLLTGSVGGLKQRKLKTLLAYSSINHMGYLIMALSMGSFFGIKLLIIYLIIYVLSGICIWFSLLLLKLKDRNSKYSKELSDLTLLSKSNPALAVSLAVTLFSTAGLPPFIGFVTKIGIFLSLLKSNFYGFCILAVICSVISTFYYIRIVKIMFFENVLVGKLYYPIKTNKTWVLSFFTFLLIFLFINPKTFFLIIHFITSYFKTV